MLQTNPLADAAELFFSRNQRPLKTKGINGSLWLLIWLTPLWPPSAGVRSHPRASNPRRRKYSRFSFLTQKRASALRPWASRPSTSANFFNAGRAFFNDDRPYSTMLVRRWNWSTVNPAKDAPAPPVGNV